jgi:methionyl-tRNA formyltransferase
MGSGTFSVPVLTALLDGGPKLRPAVEVVGIVSQPDRPAGRGRRVTVNVVAAVARDRHVPLVQPRRLRESESLADLAHLRPDVVIVAAYGQILPAADLAIPKRGCLNLHPSLLPRHRGPAPVVATILNGDAQTGTTLMLMNERMDEGPIVDQVETAVDRGETAGDLEARLAALSGEMLLRDLPSWLNGDGRAVPQDGPGATYTGMLSKSDARVAWGLAADDIDRRIRAFDPWPVAHCLWRDRQMRLFRSESRAGDVEPGLVLGLEDGRLAIGAAGGVVLIAELQLAGGRRLTAAEVVRGHSDLVGAHLG